MLSFFRRYRIRTKLLLIMLLSGLPVAVTVFFLLYAKYRTDYREAEHAIQVAVEAIAFQHEAHVEGIHTLLATIARFPEVKRKDKKACAHLLQGILKQNPSSHNVGIADIDGTLIASGVTGSGANFSIGDRKYFKDALRTKRFSVGEYTLSRAVAKPAIHFALPVLDDAAHVVVVIYATFDLNHFNTIFEAQKLPPGSALNITDHQGFFLHRYPPHPLVKPGLLDRSDLRAHMTGEKSQGGFNEFGRDNVKRFLAFKRLQLYPDEAPYLYIRASIPEKEALASVHYYLLLAGGLFVVAALFALLCSRVFAGRFLVAPLERLADVAESAQKGDFSVRTGLPASNDEIGRLAQTFDSMAASLEAQRTERDSAELELRSSEQKFSAVFEKSPITVALTSYPAGVFLEVNQAFSSTFGFSREEALGRSTGDLNVWVNPEDRQRYLQMISGEAYVNGFETVMRTKDGTLINVLFSGGSVDINGGKYVLSAIVDISEQKRMELALRESERRFRELLENVHLVAVLLDRQGNVSFCNDFLLTLTDWTRDEVLGHNWFERFITRNDEAQVRQLFFAAIESESIPAHHENRIQTRSGEQRLIVWDNTMLKDASGTVIGTASIGLDVTDHRNTEAQLLQSQKMEAIGKLAGGVAHDFNNLLTPIMGYSEMLWKDLAARGENVERVERITQAAMKARDLTRQLLSFGRKQTLEMQKIDLNEVVSSFVEIFHRTIRESIVIKMLLSADRSCILADRIQIEQIVMNLVVNAQDAIADNGIITIETASTVLDEEFVRSHPAVKAGTYVMLAVSDSGHGIDKNNLNHIFEPFFSTKEVGKGTGLGLATVYGIVKQHEGNIWVYSEPGQGTVFKIFIPVVDGVAFETPEASQVVPVARTASGTILLVEDNETVRTLVNELLTECGYRVLATEDPVQALTLATTCSIDLLVTDVVMPGMNGPELHRQLLEMYPDLRVLFMSGYTNNVVAQHIEMKVGDNFIQKPFAVDALLRKVADVLGNQPCNASAAASRRIVT